MQMVYVLSKRGQTGKSNTIHHLANRASESGFRVAVVDLDDSGHSNTLVSRYQVALKQNRRFTLSYTLFGNIDAFQNSSDEFDLVLIDSQGGSVPPTEAIIGLTRAVTLVIERTKDYSYYHSVMGNIASNARNCKLALVNSSNDPTYRDEYLNAKRFLGQQVAGYIPFNIDLARYAELAVNPYDDNQNLSADAHGILVTQFGELLRNIGVDV
jgi:CobQ/CobB/MinD/ParA nucleotide binding domain